MSKPASHLLDVYSCWVHVATDLKAWAKLRGEVTSLTKKPPVALASTKHEAELMPGGGQVQHFVVYIDLDAHRLEDMAARRRFLVETCSHEAAHVAGLLLDHFEHEYDGKDEPHAYLVGWLSQWLWQAVESAT